MFDLIVRSKSRVVVHRGPPNLSPTSSLLASSRVAVNAVKPLYTNYPILLLLGVQTTIDAVRTCFLIAYILKGLIDALNQVQPNVNICR